VQLPDDPEVRRTLDLLLSGNLASVDQVPDQLRPLLRSPDRGAAGRYSLLAFGHPHGEALISRIRELADAAGLKLARNTAGVTLVAGVGEPHRELLDGLTQAGQPYLVIRLVEGRAVVGPCVVPGRTACLRCIDAMRTDEDQSWPLLVEQYADASSRDRRDGATEPVDPVLAALACAWAVRDAISFLEGHRPSTWSSTVTMDARLHDVRSEEWLRHPACGCAWGTWGYVDNDYVIRP
jgi:bacteriocin biosynthesis cyclodehydratase domain-containing protein